MMKKQTFLKSLLLILSIILVIFAGFRYLKLKDKSYQLDNFQSSVFTQLDLGAFTLRIKTNQLIDPEGKQKSVEKSKIIQKQLDEHTYEKGECASIENIYTLWYQEKSDDGLINGNNLWWTSFTEGEQKFKNNEAKAAFSKYLRDLKQLLTIKDGDLLKTTIKGFNILSLNQCSGGWFYPVYKQEIKNSAFDKIIYVEVNAGNGDAIALPKRYLIIKKNNSWLLFNESLGQDFPDMSSDLTTCRKQQGSLEERVNCTAKVWDKYRSEDSVDTWAQGVLAKIAK